VLRASRDKGYPKNPATRQ